MDHYITLHFWIIFVSLSSKKEMIHQFVSFLFWNLHFWIIFLHKLVDQYGALYLHTVTTRWIITCLHGWSSKSWIILLGSGGGGVYGVGDP